MWLSCYIYHDEVADVTLTEKIAPLIQKILEKNYASQFFFIRYSDKIGPHIRLRFNGEKNSLAFNIKPLLKQTFSQIRFVKYKPELKRYGGKNGIIIAEKQFQASSETVLAFLDENKETSYERSLGFALQFNISMIHAVGIKKPEAIAFFDHLSKNSYTKEYDANIDKQQKMLFPFLTNFWNALDQKAVFTNKWFTTWLVTMQTIGNDLQTAYKNKQLRFVDPQKAHPQNPLWYIYESYIHMNNNRLGITTIDEPYVAYIIKRALEIEA